jgi:multicomponent Na+:H+ antiporter subunit B
VVVTATVRLVAPFVLTLGLFTMFHGTSSVGGGFQGGVVVASMLVTVAFAFGVGQTWRWLSRAGLLALAVAGVLVFGAVAGGSLLLGESFLELGAYPVEKAVVYGTEAVELGIGATVAATVSVLFFEIAGAAADAGPSTGTGTGAGAGGRDDAGRSDGGTPPSGERRDAAGSDRGGAP